MNVSLTPELEHLVKEIKSGQYKSVIEVVPEGLRLVRLRREKPVAFRSEIRLGIDDIERGDSIGYTSVDELFRDIKSEVTKRAAKKRKPRQ